MEHLTESIVDKVVKAFSPGEDWKADGDDGDDDTAASTEHGAKLDRATTHIPDVLPDDVE